MSKWLVVLSDGTWLELDSGHFLVEVKDDFYLDGDFPVNLGCEDMEDKLPGVLSHIHLEAMLTGEA